MKNKFVWVSAVILALQVTSEMKALAQLTNGVIVITTRRDEDLGLGATEVFNQKGPGNTAPGDTGMAALLEDYGYVARVLSDSEVKDNWAAYEPADPNFSIALLIASGSSASSQVPPAPHSNIPVMMGEHSDLGSDNSKPGSIFMYQGTGSNDPNDSTGGTGATKYMKVINPSHPIMQGIPLDSEGRVKIFRDMYPEENAHLPSAGSPKPNYEYRWCTQTATNAAPGTVILGVLAGSMGAIDDTNRACFAICDAGGILATNALLGYAPTNVARLVHLFVNENGNGGVRRAFLALTDLGRVIFVRAAKWAMGETLTPFQGLGIIDVSLLNNQQIRISWQASSQYNYKILGTTNLNGPSDFSNWQTILQDIHGNDATVSRTLSIAGAVNVAFLRVKQSP
jgi:hypothetical protein